MFICEETLSNHCIWSSSFTLLPLFLFPVGPINTKANDSGFVGQTEQKGGRASRSSLQHNGAWNFDIAMTFSMLNMTTFYQFYYAMSLLRLMSFVEIT